MASMNPCILHYYQQYVDAKAIISEPTDILDTILSHPEYIELANALYDHGYDPLDKQHWVFVMKLYIKHRAPHTIPRCISTA